MSTSDRSHPFVRHAEQRFLEFRQSEQRGDVAAYKRTRTQEVYATTLANLRKGGQPPGDLGPMLKKAALWQIDLSKFRFVRCEARAGGARLIYQRDGEPDATGPRVEFAVIMTRWEDGAWRIGWVGRESVPKTEQDQGASALLGNPRFALE